MKQLLMLRARLSLAVTLIILAAILSACAAKPPSVIRGTSEVKALKNGEIAIVPPTWEPRVMYCLSPPAYEEIMRAAGERLKE